MKFGEITDALQSGKSTKARREGWQSNGAFITLDIDDGIFYWQSDHHPAQHYTPPHCDLLANDWEVE